VTRRPVPKKRRLRPIRWLQRAVLGAMMTVVAFVVEKRLLKALKKERKPPPEAQIQAEGEQDLSAAV